MIAILGIDPGLSTGIGEILKDGPDILRGMIFQGEPKHALKILDGRLQHHASKGNQVIIACELFRQSGRAPLTVQPEATETAVLVRNMAEIRGVRFVGQPPGDAKRVCSNTLLQASGLWVLPSEVGQKDADDVNDGLRHAVLAMSRYRATMFDQLMALAAERG
jgi:hypothetical protein